MPKERNKADGYREKAADKGDMQSQVNVANAYYLGNGTEMDHHKAFLWYREAAFQGHVQSQKNCGAAYWNGDGVEKDLSECAFWYELAANGGDAQSQFATGWFLIDGVLKFQTLVDYFGSYALVEVALLLLVILSTLAIYKFTKEHKTESK